MCPRMPATTSRLPARVIASSWLCCASGLAWAGASRGSTKAPSAAAVVSSDSATTHTAKVLQMIDFILMFLRPCYRPWFPVVRATLL